MEQLEADKAMLVAETKQGMHEALEIKDEELQKIRKSCLSLNQEKDELTEIVQRLEKLGECSGTRNTCWLATRIEIGREVRQ